MGEIARLQESNQQRLQAYAEKGIRIPAESVMDLRKDLMFKAIYEAVVPKDAQQALELEFERTISLQIDAIDKRVEEMEAQGRVKTLLQGVPGVNPADLKAPGE